MAAYQYIEFEIKNKAATIWFNRPEKHNAFNREMMLEIIHCLQQLKNEPVRILFLKGNGPSFCAGGDLQWFTNWDEKPEDISQLMSQCFQEIYEFPAPVIASVHGNIMGGGMGFMCASDIVLAETSSIFAFPEVQIGMVPAVVSTYVLKRLQPSVAKNLMFTGKKISSKEAFELKLVDFKGSGKEIESYSEFILNKINQASPLAVKETKALINKIYNLPVSAEVINQTTETFSKMRNSEDFAEGTKALSEKRKPNWKN